MKSLGTRACIGRSRTANTGGKCFHPLISLYAYTLYLISLPSPFLPEGSSVMNNIRRILFQIYTYNIKPDA